MSSPWGWGSVQAIRSLADALLIEQTIDALRIYDLVASRESADGDDRGQLGLIGGGQKGREGIKREFVKKAPRAISAATADLKTVATTDLVRTMPQPQPQQRADTAPLTTTTMSLAIDRETLLHFRQEAARRDVTVACLITDILDVIANDRLVGAILDR
jgi:hypothetical protein